MLRATAGWGTALQFALVFFQERGRGRRLSSGKTTNLPILRRPRPVVVAGRCAWVVFYFAGGSCG